MLRANILEGKHSQSLILLGHCRGQDSKSHKEFFQLPLGQNIHFFPMAEITLGHSGPGKVVPSCLMEKLNTYTVLRLWQRQRYIEGYVCPFLNNAGQQSANEYSKERGGKEKREDVCSLSFICIMCEGKLIHKKDLGQENQTKHLAQSMQ